MNSDKWQKIGIIFEEALKLDEPGRSAFLQSACENDSEMIDEVRSLIEADSNVPEFLKGQAADSININLNKNYEGITIGKYKIKSQIAEGGMGSVFLAERADGQFQQKVALKIIKPGMNSAEIIRRFGNERQILASLQHPNIARLLDGGLTEENLPYFTMEYVEGKPIDEYCGENKLTIEERLILFSKVCTVVQYAHQNLVIHRDLKPGNIMIKKDRTVKLLDFGIAKVLSEDEHYQQTAFTGTGFTAMTPEYASPEQIKGKHVTTSTDIYSLGLVLYQLLTGQKAYRIQSRIPAELEKIICLTEPQKPSSRITSKKNKAVQEKNIFPDSFKIEADKLKKILSGDLDNICLMALRKEPERRYNSAEQFRQDILNYLAGRPVNARQSTAAYRTGKFISRHKFGVITAAVIFILIASITAFYTNQLANERDKARLEAVKAEQVADFLKNIFKVSDPYQARGETITARELLDKGAKKINMELSDQPSVKATMLNLIGEVYINLGLYNKAEKLLKEALIIRQKYNEGKAENAKSLDDLGEVYMFKGEYAKAVPLIRQSIAMYDEISQKNGEDFATTLGDLAWYYFGTGSYEKSDSVYIAAIKLLKKEFGDKSELLYTLINDLALNYHEEGKYEAADSLFKEALTAQKKLYGNKPHPELSTTTYNYAELLRDKGNYDEAEKMFKTSLSMDIALDGPEHPDVAYSMQGLASIYRIKGNYDKAKALFQKVLDMRIKFLGKEHPDVAYAISNIGLVYYSEQKYDSAKIFYRKSLLMHEKLNGEKHTSVASCLNKLSFINYKEGNYKKAEEQARRSLAIEKNTAGGNNLTYAGDLLILSFIKSELNDKDSVKILNSEVIKSVTNSMGKFESPFMANCLSAFAKIATDEADYKAADSLYRQALDMHNRIMGEKNILTVLTNFDFADYLIRTKSLDKAYSVAEKNLILAENQYGQGSWITGIGQERLGEILFMRGKYSESEKLLSHGFMILKKEYGIGDYHTKEAAHKLIALYNKLGKKKKAEFYISSIAQQ